VELNWTAIRAQFPALKNWTWLNTATYGQIPARTRTAVDAHFARREETACTDFLDWFDDMDELRSLIAQLIHCDAQDIAFTTNAASALSLFLAGVDWQAGDRILTLHDEFPNQVYFAASLAERGVSLLQVKPVELNEIETLPERTRAVLMSTVNYSNGYRPDIARISRLTHEAGALLYLDGTQSVGALTFDIAAIKPDMLAVDGYKWLLCPNGATFFYVSPELRQNLRPAVIGWRSDKGWRSVDQLHHGTPTMSEAAEKYEGGMLNFPSLYGLREAVRMMLEIGTDRIEQRVLELAALTAGILRDAGAAVINQNTIIVAAHWPDRDASVIARSLQAERIIVAARHGNLRVSPHFYNTEEDLERFRKSLRDYC
jgi:cysteine desulfurase / selenocysteine lyase